MEEVQEKYELKINSIGVLYYSLLQIGFPIIDSLVLVNNTEEELKNIKIKINFDFDFIEDYEQDLDLLEGKSFAEIEIKLGYNAKKIFELNEKLLDTCKVEVYSDEKLILKDERKITILPRKQWSGITVVPETIASFVMPNIPEVSAIVARAGEILEKKTGNASFTGYMTGNKNRVVEQLSAIYAAIYELNIVYSSLPASFEHIGQRVRTPEELYNLRQGNCVEMSVLFASVCESVGLNPFIVVVEGHAFVGLWLTDELFDTSVEVNASELNKRLADGINDILVLEATYMNKSSEKNFDQAVRAAKGHLEDEDKFYLSVDVKRCHYLGITPMPILSSENGELKVVDYGYANDAETKAVVGKDIQDYFIDTNQKTEVTKSSIWMKNMLDLSKRNNLISFRPSAKNLQLYNCDLSELEDYLSRGESFTFTEVAGSLRVARKSNRLIEVENSQEFQLEISKADFKAKKLRTYMEEEDMNYVLKNIYRETQTSIEENGSSSLFLAMGFLKWFDPKEQVQGMIKYRFAPLVLVPIEIVRKNLKNYEIRLRDEDSQMNVTLLEFLKQNYNLSIGGLNPLPEDENGVDIKLVFNSIRKAIMDQKGWDVLETAFVGNFAFSQFVMWNDLKDRFDKLTQNKIVKGLVDGFYIDENMRKDAHTDIDSHIKNKDILIPFSTDSSQLSAVVESVEGNSFVLHGPPGTGKSQTITNIIANALYNGKSVLFVAEKMAALNVVYDRLAKLGLEDFSLELHSNKTSKRVVLEKFESSMNFNHTHNEENYTRKNTKLLSIGDKLNTEVLELHKTDKSGYSIYELISQLESYSEPGKVWDFTQSELDKIKVENIENSQYIIKVVSRILAENEVLYKEHPLKEFKNIQYTSENQQKVSQLIGDLQGKLSVLNSISTSVKVKTLGDFSYLDIIRNMLTKIEERNMSTEISKAMWAVLLNRDFDDFMKEFNLLVAKHQESQNVIETKYSQDLFNLSIPNIREEYVKATTAFFMKGGKIKKALAPINAVAKNNHIVDESNVDFEFSKINEYLDLRVKLDQNILKLESMLNHKFTSFDKVDAINDIYEFVKLSRDLGQRYSYTNDQLYDVYASISTLDGVELRASLEEVKDINISIDELSAMLSYDFSDIRGDDNFLSLLSGKLDRWTSSLDMWRDYDRLYKTIAELQNENLVDFKDVLLEDIFLGQVESEKLENNFMYSLLKSLAHKQINENSNLVNFNSLNTKEMILEYNKLIDEVESISVDQIRTRLAANLPTNREVDTNTKLELAKLNRVIRSKGRGTSIRKIFQEYGSVIKSITPCLLMSPLSVAQYIDLDFPKFDLVIFDEASQIKTGIAVGAMSRAENCIIVGDPNQMPPTDFFGSTKLDEENIHVEDLESLLEDCLAINMPQRYLTHHYRSASESLIAFSNSMYYKNKMLTFPGTSDHTSKVTFRKVEDGVYDRGVTRTNKKEAEAIVGEIVSRLSSKKNDSIGVVTFNASQQELIDDLLQAEFLKAPRLQQFAEKMKEPIFIKNLENVQGDERDVILFSITFAKDENGKFTQNFGPLGRKGGWRRLNVAVSRARKEMQVFSSIGHEDIAISARTSEGVVGLKKFLEYSKLGLSTLVNKKYSTAEENLGIIDSIKNELEKRGYEVATNFGASKLSLDLVVKDKEIDSYISAIILDGPNYKALDSTRDRNRLLTQVLNAKEWDVYRIWTLDYLNNKEKVLTELCLYLEGLVEKFKEKQQSKEEVETDIVEEPIQEETIPENKEEILLVEETPLKSLVVSSGGEYIISSYERYMSSGSEEVISVYDAQASIIGDIAKNILEKEAPILEELLLRRIMEHFKESKITANIKNHILTALVSNSIESVLENDEAVYYGNIERFSYKEVRLATDDYRRDFEHIPLVELENKIIYLLSQNTNYKKEDLIRELTKAFQFARATQKMQDRANFALDNLVASSKIIISDGYVYMESYK